MTETLTTTIKIDNWDEQPTQEHDDGTKTAHAVVTLTDAGLDEFRRVGTRHSHSIAAKMSALTPDELRQLAMLTDKLRAGLSGSRSMSEPE